ncbi:TPA: acetyl-CoA carboxylase carboxyl transferase subunit alpha [Clostridioides difficile]|nr:acetyl-CoA carboxylase carboxyl transferase subunit alpha [Clostridioides difficile]HBF7790548.1 acetyl-CoA carboxylase carboxyl transferase subunit alpha [Clostridioides difficile]
MSEIEKDNSSWEKLNIAREEFRYPGRTIIKEVFDYFIEFHGDRLYGDDKSIIAGLAQLNNIPVTVIVQNKGIENEERKASRYGMTLPEGYRKSLRLMKQADKFNRPIICFVNTPGAYPGVEAEKRGQAEAIAKNICEMSNLKVPIFTVIVGEGGSGGALALAVANRIFIMENSVFSVVSPEACASILWRDSKQAPQAAQYLRITSGDLLDLGIIDKIIVEKGTQKEVYQRIKKTLHNFLVEYAKMTMDEIVTERKMKYREIGKAKEDNYECRRS